MATCSTDTDDSSNHQSIIIDTTSTTGKKDPHVALSSLGGCDGKLNGIALQNRNNSSTCTTQLIGVTLSSGCASRLLSTLFAPFLECTDSADDDDSLPPLLVDRPLCRHLGKHQVVLCIRHVETTDPARHELWTCESRKRLSVALEDSSSTLEEIKAAVQALLDVALNLL